MSDRRELEPGLDTVLLEAMAGNQAQIWTALPAIVQSYNATLGTVEAYSALQFQKRVPDGGYETISPQPLFVDCPVVFPGGGGFTLTFPIKPGDEVLIIFASRCIDAWWDSSGVQAQAEFRMHDMSDGFAIVGPRSRPRALTAASTGSVELRNDSRAAFVAIDGSGDIKVQTAGTLTIQAATVNIVGAVNITGVVTNNTKVVGSGIKVSGVTPGGGNSSGVV